MLVIVDSPRAKLDPGTVSLALLRCFDEQGPDVLFIDATIGSSLARRFGEAIRFDLAPGDRGVPTLIAAGAEAIKHSSITEHCYRLDNPGSASSWLMFAPTSHQGAAHAASWLDGHDESIAALGESFRLVVASSLRGGRTAPSRLLRRADCLVVIAPAAGEADRAALADPFAGTGVPDSAGQRRLLLVESASKPHDADLAGMCPLDLLGRLPTSDDARLLMPTRRLRRTLSGLAAAVDEARAATDGRPEPVVPPGAARRPRQSRRAEPAEAPAAPTLNGRPEPVVPPGAARRPRQSRRAEPAEAPAAPTLNGRPPPVQPGRRRRPPPESRRDPLRDPTSRSSHGTQG